MFSIHWGLILVNNFFWNLVSITKEIGFWYFHSSLFPMLRIIQTSQFLRFGNSNR